MTGCTFVMHVASPFRIANPKNDDDMIGPALEGTKRVIQAAKNSGIKRVVLTSSIVTMMCSIRRGQFGPEDWTDSNDPELSTYIRSKVLAEKAAWKAVNNNGGMSLELVVIAPGGVFGPPLGTDISGESLSVLSKMLNGKIPLVPETAFPMVDVRDVAKLHLKAMLDRDVAGERFIAAGTDPISFADIAEILLNNGYTGPSKKKAPRWLLKFLSIFDREASGMLALVGMQMRANNSKTCQVFDWTPIPFERSVIDSASAVQKLMDG